MRSAFIRARIEPELKHKVENLLKELGLSSTQAIRLFYKQIELQKGLPFPVRIPNKETEETFEMTDKKQGLVSCDDVEDMFRKLESHVETDIHK